MAKEVCYFTVSPSFCLQPKYEFTQENPYKETESPFQKGMEKLKEGDLPSAILYFEAAVSVCSGVAADRLQVCVARLLYAGPTGEQH